MYYTKQIVTKSTASFVDFSNQLLKCDDSLLNELEANGKLTEINDVIKKNWKSYFVDQTKEMLRIARKICMKISNDESHSSNMKNKIQSLAEILFQNKKYDQCIEIIELSPYQIGDISDINIMLLESNALMFKGNVNRAQMIMDKIDKELLNEYPMQLCKYYEIQLKMLNCKKQYTKAIEYYDSIISINTLIKECSQYADILVQIAKTYFALQNYENTKFWHNQALDLRVKMLGDTHADSAQSYQSLGSLFYELKDYTNSLNYSMKAYEVRKNACGFYTSEVGLSCYCIANSYLMLGKPSDAVKYFEESLEIKKKLNGEKCEDVANLSDTIASLYIECNDFNNAIKYYKQSLSIYNILFGSNSISTVKAMNKLGSAIYYSHDTALAKTTLEDSAKIRDSMCYQYNIDTVDSEYVLAMIYKTQGDTTGSIKHMDIALNIIKALGKYYESKTADIHCQLALLYLYKANYKQSVDNFLKYFALSQGMKTYDDYGDDIAQCSVQEIQKYMLTEINKSKKQNNYTDPLHIYIVVIGLMGFVNQQYENSLGYMNKALSDVCQKQDFIDYVAILNTVAQLNIYKGDFEKGGLIFKQAYDVVVENMGKNSPECCIYYSNMSSLSLIKNDAAAALKFSNMALNAKLKVYQPNHPEIAASYNNVAVIFQQKGDKESAMKNYLHALEIYKKNSDCGTEIAAIYLNLGNLYADRNDFNNSLAYLQKCLELRVNILGKYNADVGMINTRIGVLLITKASYDNALGYFNTALDIYSKIYKTADNIDMATLYYNIGFIHKITGKKDTATSYLEKAYAIQKKLLGEANEMTRKTYNLLK